MSVQCQPDTAPAAAQISFQIAAAVTEITLYTAMAMKRRNRPAPVRPLRNASSPPPGNMSLLRQIEPHLGDAEPPVVAGAMHHHIHQSAAQEPNVFARQRRARRMLAHHQAERIESS